jgi:hypothetical protein
MGTMTFQLPPDLPRHAARDLERACLAGGPDNMPWPTEQRLTPDRLSLQRLIDESGHLVAPWDVEGFGRLCGTSATLMEREPPYHLLVELARGKVNQVRGQAADWRAAGLQIVPALQQRIHDASLSFGRAVTADNGADPSADAGAALRTAYQAADELVRTYWQQVFQIRHQRQPRLDTVLSCGLGAAVPAGPPAAALAAACNGVSLSLSWHVVEAEEGAYNWAPYDALLQWAEEQHLAVSAGPLIDFTSSKLPPWLWLWERDVSGLATFMNRFVEAAVRRYRGRVRRWQLTNAANCSTVLRLGEDQLLSLTYRLAETARAVDPALEIVVGVAQPWGEYMTLADRTHSPFIFADTLIRSGLSVASLDLEIVMGVAPRGSYCRDLLEVSRLLDFYALLGVPLSVTLGYPAAEGPDPDADPDMRLDAGRWREGFMPETQAGWADAFAAVAACKPFVQGVRWTHFSDAEPHLFPHCGLVDCQGQPRPALARLRALREAHLR